MELNGEVLCIMVISKKNVTINFFCGGGGDEGWKELPVLNRYWLTFFKVFGIPGKREKAVKCVGLLTVRLRDEDDQLILSPLLLAHQQLAQAGARCACQHKVGFGSFSEAFELFSPVTG
jgi:hypothetical protein